MFINRSFVPMKSTLNKSISDVRTNLAISSPPAALFLSLEEPEPTKKEKILTLCMNNCINNEICILIGM